MGRLNWEDPGPKTKDPPSRSHKSCAAARRRDFSDELDHARAMPFLSRKLPPCSIIRPTETRGVAMSVINFLTAMKLFIGQSPAFFELLKDLAKDADSARRED
jgi:hypothetical protein